jgi:cellulose synthase (UDP-forming)
MAYASVSFAAAHPALALASLSDQSKRRVLFVAINVGVVAMGFYYSWWLEPARGFNLLLAPLLLLAVFYNAAQVFAAWFIYSRIQRPAPRLAPPGLTVDVFVPVYDEDAALVERSLTAAISIKYPHRTVLLDDAHRDDFKQLAARVGADYVRRDDHRHAKAGNVNHALQFSTADFVTVFDVDHIPEPHFLDVVLGHFDDPRVGFVQALVTHGNQGESFVASAVAAQAYDVFSPTSMGMNGCGAATVWGAHCTFRRAALDSIGGHQVGLAEDLHTSLVLHAKGWKSVYVPTCVARGLVPADLGAYVIQQLKWSRGVFEILTEKSPTHLRRLELDQALAYITRMTYYLVGPFTLISMTAVGAMLYFGRQFGEVHMASYIVHFIPSTITIMVVRALAVTMWEQDPEAGRFHYHGLALALGSWPIYTISLVCALLRLRLPHLATPKQARGGHFWPMVVPQILAVILLLGGIAWRVSQGLDLDSLIVVGFAAMLASSHWAVFYAVWEGWRRQRGERRERVWAVA